MSDTQFEKLAIAVKRVRSRPSADRVHDLRTTVRRLEALVFLAGPAAAPAMQPDELTRLGRIVSGLRDLDITAAWLGKPGRARDDTRKLAERLRRARRRREAAALRRLEGRRVERILAKLRQWSRGPLIIPRKNHLDELDQAYRLHPAWLKPVPRSIEEAVANPDTVAPHHDLRRRTRLYRYALEATPANLHPDRGWHPPPAKTQVALGRLHDLVTIARRLFRLAGGTDRLAPALLANLTAEWHRGHTDWEKIARRRQVPAATTRIGHRPSRRPATGIRP